MCTNTQLCGYFVHGCKVLDRGQINIRVTCEESMLHKILESKLCAYWPGCRVLPDWKEGELDDLLKRVVVHPFEQAILPNSSNSRCRSSRCS